MILCKIFRKWQHCQVCIWDIFLGKDSEGLLQWYLLTVDYFMYVQHTITADFLIVFNLKEAITLKRTYFEFDVFFLITYDGCWEKYFFLDHNWAHYFLYVWKDNIMVSEETNSDWVEPFFRAFHISWTTEWLITYTSMILCFCDVLFVCSAECVLTSISVYLPIRTKFNNAIHARIQEFFKGERAT